jgi:hypothetical protein
MNADLSIHRMAFREADSLGVAQQLVVKKRQELEERLQRERIEKGEAASQASIDRALREMEAESRRESRDKGHRVDKTA